MSQRLLLYFSYIGTNYNGMQRATQRCSSVPDFNTVQGIFEFGLNKLLRTKDSSLYISSRTDTGVHAISSTAHFDYNCPDGNPMNSTSPEKLCENLNSFFEKNKTEIRVKRIVQVDDNFWSRGASSRTYCYRLAVVKPDQVFSCTFDRFNTPTSVLPISTINRCQLVPQPFDPCAIFEACKIFIGTKNFRSFSKVSEDRDKKEKEPEDYVKTIHRVSLTRVSTDSESESTYFLDESSTKFDIYDFHFQGSGFLRRQVRKMVGILLGIGCGKITIKDIQYMLENPHERNWNPLCYSAGPDGLYLKSVEYKNLNILRGFLS